VVLRRAIPLLTPLVLMATLLLMPRLDTGQNPGLWLLLYHVPTLIFAISLCLRELPTFEIPPWPRRWKAPDRRAAASPLVPAGTRSKKRQSALASGVNPRLEGAVLRLLAGKLGHGQVSIQPNPPQPRSTQ